MSTNSPKYERGYPEDTQTPLLLRPRYGDERLVTRPSDIYLKWCTESVKPLRFNILQFYWLHLHTYRELVFNFLDFSSSYNLTPGTHFRITQLKRYYLPCHCNKVVSSTLGFTWNRSFRMSKGCISFTNTWMYTQSRRTPRYDVVARCVFALDITLLKNRDMALLHRDNDTEDTQTPLLLRPKYI